jgi:hypothetical protein
MHNRRTIRTAQAAFKGNIYVPELSYPTLKIYRNLKRQPNKKCLRLKIDHISANSKQNSKKALARESGAQGVLFDEKPKAGNLVTLLL